MPRQMPPGAAARHLALARQRVEYALPQRLGDERIDHAAQARRVHTGVVRHALMLAFEHGEYPFGERLPVSGQDPGRASSSLHPQSLGRQHSRRDRRREQPLEQRFVHTVGRLPQQRSEPLAFQQACDRLEPGTTPRRTALALGCVRVEHAAAAKGAVRLGVAEDETIARCSAQRFLENQLHEPSPAGRQEIAFERYDVSEPVRRGEVHMHRRAHAERRRVRRERQFHIEMARG